ncbi:MAG: RNA pseudouridine synthase [Prevotella sp.]|nr:RNA pseudouridine synthase [Prevotella sp.]
MEPRIHPLQATVEPPELFTYPFCYEPHPLCMMAAKEVQAYIATHPQLKEDADRGKMFGVLVVRTPQLGFLAAYSGLLAGRNDWSWFVPPVFDAQQPEGYFKTNEALISEKNRHISQLEEQLAAMHQDEAYLQTKETVSRLIAQHEQQMRAAKAMRDLRRLQHNIPPEENAALVRESQFMKAEMRRIKNRCEEMERPWKEKEGALKREIQQLKHERHQHSDSLQRWLFSQYRMLNAQGEEKDLMQIFNSRQPLNEPSQRIIPPAGSGDCCAPKLLQYAYQHHWQPLCMAEFWWGDTPKAEIRHHLNYYPACRSKCLPILTWMMQGLHVEPNPMDECRSDHRMDDLIVYEDDSIAVINKPAGMPSVPGKIGRKSLETMLRERWHDDVNPLIVHRLDMETSGLMVVAKTKWAHQVLQKQFLEHQVKKTYVALLEGMPVGKALAGTIRLPLRPDIDNRPRQLVDFEHGKEAVTEYEIQPTPPHSAQKPLIILRPLTGRTHQLRVHCAHRQGLGMPILGDELYGHKSERLCLHAETLTFVHPRTGERLSFTQPAPF